MNYDAFISYRRSDGTTVARWLKRQLEDFRVPKALRKSFDRKLRVYLDTAYERGTSDFYEHNVKPALLSSKFLLVVATPDALAIRDRNEDWIKRELNDFAAGPNAHNLIAVRGAGDFDGPLPGDLKSRFPNVEIVDLRGAGRFWFLNPSKAARLASEKLKLVAPLLGLPLEEMPRLRQEEERRQQVRMGALIGGVLGTLTAVSSLSVLALQSRNQAVRAAEDSMFAAGSMALRAAALQTNETETSDLRRLIINQGCDLIDKFRREALSEPQIEETVMCRLERGQHYNQLGEHPEAVKQFREAIELARERHERLGRMDAAIALTKARQAFAQYYLKRKETVEAEVEYKALLKDSRDLGKVHGERADFSFSEGEALGQLGDLEVARRKNSTSGASLYDEAADAVARGMVAKNQLGKSPDPQTVTWLLRLHRLSGQQYAQLGNVGAAIERYRRAASAGSNEALQSDPLIAHEIALSQALLFSVEHNLNHADTSQTARDLAFKAIDVILNSASASSDLRNKALNIKRWVEDRDARK